ncbi:unnamed protein product [Boreogadus saida]
MIHAGWCYRDAMREISPEGRAVMASQVCSPTHPQILISQTRARALSLDKNQKLLIGQKECLIALHQGKASGYSQKQRETELQTIK